jgi:hypothetical protein
LSDPAPAPPAPITERVLGVVDYENGYAGLIETMRARSDELNISTVGPSVAQVSGLASHYFAKVLSPNPMPKRRFGALSLGPILGTLGIKLKVCVDDRAVQKFTSRLDKRQQNRVHSRMHSSVVQIALSHRFLRKIGAKGGANSRKNLGKRLRRALARKAANARWEKVRAREAAKVAAQAEAAYKKPPPLFVREKVVS